MEEVGSFTTGTLSSDWEGRDEGWCDYIMGKRSLAKAYQKDLRWGCYGEVHSQVGSCAGMMLGDARPSMRRSLGLRDNWHRRGACVGGVGACAKLVAW
jgi:hypothetical protein